MAYTSCAAKIAANIKQDCDKPLVGGYTGRAVIMSVLDFERADVVRSATNKRKIMSIVLPQDGSVMPYTVDNVFSAPFTGSTTAGNNDNGRNGYLKTVIVRVPKRGADTSMQVIEPLVKDPNGFVMVLEKRDKVGDGSYEVIGYQNALRGDIAGVTRDESANGGDWIVPMKTIEKWAEVTLVGSSDDCNSAKKEFEGLYGFEPKVMIMTTSVVDQEFFELSANGLVYIDSVKNGQKVRQKLVNPNAEFVKVSNDVNTEIVVRGEVTYLYAGDDANTGLTSLDLSKNTALTVFGCYGCTGLTSLDVSKNTALTNLSCGDCTGLTSLDLSKNTALTELYCYDCTGLTSLDLSKNTALTVLVCNDCTGLTSLDLSKNTALTVFGCNDCTGLTSLDLSNTAKIKSGNIFTGISTSLTTLKVAGTSTWAYTQVENWLKCNAPSNGHLYADENTPQSVITAATAKSWEVIR